MLANATECGFKERVTEWIKNGGTWIVGPLSDIMTDNASKYTEAPFSFLEELGGVYTKYNIPFDTQVDKLVKTHFVDNGQEIKTSLNYDAFETVDSEALAVYSGGEDFDGLAAITRRKVGKGQIIILGTGVDGDALLKLIDRAPIAVASENIELIERSGKECGIIALELQNKEGFIELTKEYYDILNEKTVSGRVEVKPFEALFLKEIK
jgi:beta-galactosidase GanA